MTGPCSGTVVGIPKPGTAALTYIGPGAIGGALASLSGWAGAAVGAAIGALTFELVTFCPGGPPAAPTFTAADIVALLEGPIAGADYFTARQKFQDFLGVVFWPILCECPTGTVTAPSPSAYPSGAPQGGTVSPPVSPCFQVTLPQQIMPQQVALPDYWLTGQFSTTIDDVPLPVGTTLVSGTVTVSASGASHQAFSTIIQPRKADHTSNGAGINFVVGTAGAPGGPYPLTQTLSFAPPPGTVYLRSGGGSAALPVTDLVTASCQVYCGGTPGQVVVPNCSPDPNTQALLEEILKYVTLIQRQAVPFAYVPGTVHSGLSGTGSITIQGLIGAEVNVTTLPPWLGSEGTSPTQYFDLGWLTFGTPDGWPSSYRLSHDPLLMFPSRCGLYTQLDYDLGAGVVVTITELLREP